MGNSSSSHNHEPLDRHGGFQRGTYGDAINTVRTRQAVEKDEEIELEMHLMTLYHPLMLFC